MGYGKKGKKSKQALLKEYEDLRSSRALMIVVIVIGVVVAAVSLVLQAIAQGGVLVDGELASGLSMGAFAGIAIGGIVAAVGVIRFIAVNADFKVAAEKLK